MIPDLPGPGFSTALPLPWGADLALLSPFPPGTHSWGEGWRGGPTRITLWPGPKLMNLPPPEGIDRTQPIPSAGWVRAGWVLGVVCPLGRGGGGGGGPISLCWLGVGGVGVGFGWPTSPSPPPPPPRHWATPSFCPLGPLATQMDPSFSSA